MVWCTINPSEARVTFDPLRIGAHFVASLWEIHYPEFCKIILYWLVVWKMLNIMLYFPYIGNNHPKWPIYYRWVETTNQYSVLLDIAAGKQTSFATRFSLGSLQKKQGKQRWLWWFLIGDFLATQTVSPWKLKIGDDWRANGARLWLSHH